MDEWMGPCYFCPTRECVCVVGGGGGWHCGHCNIKKGAGVPRGVGSKGVVQGLGRDPCYFCPAPEWGRGWAGGGSLWVSGWVPVISVLLGSGVGVGGGNVGERAAPCYLSCSGVGWGWGHSLWVSGWVPVISVLLGSGGGGGGQCG